MLFWYNRVGANNRKEKKQPWEHLKNPRIEKAEPNERLATGEKYSDAAEINYFSSRAAEQ
jgi:hypothetical protein